MPVSYTHLDVYKRQVIGGVLGVFAALNITGMIDRIERLVGHKVFSSDVYFINYLPSDLQVLDVVLILSLIHI